MTEKELEQLVALIIKFERNELTADEEEALQQWLSEPGNGLVLEELINDPAIRDRMAQDYQRKKRVEAILESRGVRIDPDYRAGEQRGVYRGMPLRTWWAAAGVVAAVSVAAYIWFAASGTRKQERRQVATAQIKDLPPGGNRAALIIANGTVIPLDSAGNGVLSEDAGEAITKTQDGKLKYTLAASNGHGTGGNSQIAYNTLVTPRGGQYFVELSDGSKVWLNAASSLRYPARFTEGDRSVELTGEAYFEIAKAYKTGAGGDQEKVPFIVNIKKEKEKYPGKVEVLGTHFNIKAYNDDDEIRATLLEGSVKVSEGSKSVIIAPGQQAMIGGGSIAVASNVDTDEIVSWKNGVTSFSNADIRTIMRNVSRWYDVNVEFEGSIPAKTYMGGIPRSSNLSEIMKVLELNKIHTELIDSAGVRKLIVKPN